MILKKDFIEAIEDFEDYKRKQLNKPSVIRRFFCAVGLHKWTFYSREIEISNRKLFMGTENEIGEERVYKYRCECCPIRRLKVKGYTLFGDYERWEKKTYV